MTLTLEIHNDEQTIELEINQATGNVVELAIEQTVREFTFEVEVLRGPAGAPGPPGPPGADGAPGDGDMNKSVYDTDDDGVVEIAKQVQIINGGYF